MVVFYFGHVQLIKVNKFLACACDQCDTYIYIKVINRAVYDKDIKGVEKFNLKEH